MRSEYITLNKIYDTNLRKAKHLQQDSGGVTVVPVEYFDLINNNDPIVREKAMKNTLKQKKLILSKLK